MPSIYTEVKRKLLHIVFMGVLRPLLKTALPFPRLVCVYCLQLSLQASLYLLSTVAHGCQHTLTVAGAVSLLCKTAFTHSLVAEKQNDRR